MAADATNHAKMKLRYQLTMVPNLKLSSFSKACARKFHAIII